MIDISKLNTEPPKDWEEEVGAEKTKSYLKEINKLHNIFIADNSKSMLIVLQGMDASGKDSTIKKVIEAMNPNGLNIQSFKKPTEIEMAHDFLWRIHQVTPEKGTVTVFNRSHYEDVLIQRVHQWVDEDTIHKRFKHINHFEQLLQDSGTVILKFFLHISPEEQLRRLDERQVNPQKFWKHHPSDYEERKYFDNYMKCYEDVLNKCNDIPWHIIPADSKKYKSFLIAKTILETLEIMDLKYPPLVQ